MFDESKTARFCRAVFRLTNPNVYSRPLPKRRNIVLTRDASWAAEGVEVIHRTEDLKTLPGLDGRVFIIGGAEIYAAFLADLDDLLVSHLSENHAGDTWLPLFENQFPITEVVETHSTFEVRRHFRATATAEFRLATEIPPP